MSYLAQSATNIKGMSYDSLLFCKTNLGGYFFDGFLEVGHNIETEITEHPVETGAAITDHAYIKPKELTMKVCVSDVHQSLVAGQFTGKYPRHVGAWNLLKQLQQDRIPLSVFTKLGSYDNMLIKSLESSDTSETYTMLVAIVKLREIPVARVKTVKISSSPNTTDTNNLPENNATPAGLNVAQKLGKKTGGRGSGSPRPRG